MGKLTRRDIRMRMLGVGLFAVLSVITLIAARDVLHDDEAQLVSWSGFGIAASLAGVVTSVYAYREQLRQDAAGKPGEGSPVPIALGLAVGFLTFLWLRSGDPYQQLTMVGAMFGFWVGAGVGTAAALIPRWAQAPEEIEA